MADRHRLFFALLPDERVRRQILRAAETLKLEHRPRGSWTSPERLHLTLFFLGDYPLLQTDRVELAMNAAAKIGVSAFDVALEHAASFPGKSPPWALRCAEPCAALQAFWRSLGAALNEVGFAFPREASYVPHVTLLRHADRRLEPTAIDPIAWPIRDFVLMHSQVGQQRRYSLLHRWPLAAR